jgi:hypothetical protein
MTVSNRNIEKYKCGFMVPIASCFHTPRGTTTTIWDTPLARFRGLLHCCDHSVGLPGYEIGPYRWFYYKRKNMDIYPGPKWDSNPRSKTWMPWTKIRTLYAKNLTFLLILWNHKFDTFQNSVYTSINTHHFPYKVRMMNSVAVYSESLRNPYVHCVGKVRCFNVKACGTDNNQRALKIYKRTGSVHFNVSSIKLHTFHKFLLSNA